MSHPNVRTPRKPNRRRPACSQSGAAMAVALISLVVVTAFASTLLSAVRTECSGVVLENDRTQAIKAAEGALEVAENQLITQMTSYQPFPAPPLGNPFQELAGTSNVGCFPVSWSASKGTTAGAGGQQAAIPPASSIDPMTGLTLTIEPHALVANVSIGTSTLRMRRYIDTLKAPIFQFLSYYANDLEILPGPPMTLSGRIHTNGDLYCAPGASLSVATHYLRTAHNLRRHRKDDGTMPSGWIEIQNAVTNGLVTLPSKSDLAAAGVSSLYGIDSSFTGWDIDGDQLFDKPGEIPPFANAVQQLFQGTLQTGEHGVQPLAAPGVGSIQMFEPVQGGDWLPGPGPLGYVPAPAGTGTHAKGYFHKNADLVVIGTRVFNKLGVDVTTQMPAGFVTTRTLWDQRQGKTLTCTQINVGMLGDMDGNPSTKDPCPLYPGNGLLYVARTDATASQPNGVVLTNGKEIGIPDRWNSSNYGGSNPAYPGPPPAGAFPFGPAELLGLTVVTPDPLYVHGDYNTRAKKPCAAMTDAINLLSNAWDFTKTQNQIKTASATTYNLAMITGNTSTTPGGYNGGFENLPRFHENWTGKNCTITGSFVNTFLSALAKAPWVYGGAFYSAPNRIWSYETMYDQGKLPPFTPMVVTTRTVAWEVSQ